MKPRRTPRSTARQAVASIHRLSENVALPAYATPASAGFDLAAREDVVVEAGQIALVPTGLVIGVPAGHFLGIFARSSTPLRHGLIVANGVGVVDADYCGPDDEIKVQVLNVTTARVIVKRGDRLAQGVVIPYTRVAWKTRRPPSARNRGGFGSTGR